jgi:hypothetical protein
VALGALEEYLGGRGEIFVGRGRGIGSLIRSLGF